MSGAMGARSLAITGDSVCPYCGVGCRLRFEGDDSAGLRVRGVDGAPANRGRICAKGALLGPTIATPDRLTRPCLRVDRRTDFEPADWDSALRYTAEIFRHIINAHGPDAVAFYGSGQLDSETVYVVS